MGTRNVTAVYLDGEFRVAQYGQWDGYPTGQGETIRQFFSRDDLDLDRFKSRVRDHVSFLNEDQIELVNRKIKQHGGFAEAGVAHLSRDTGADILNVIYDAEGDIVLNNEIAFIGDGLFCEWAYVVDLDQGVLEVYKGFNTQPVDETNRFHFLQKTEPFTPRYEGDEPYYPPVLAASIPFGDLPDYDLSTIGRDEDDEEEEETEASA